MLFFDIFIWVTPVIWVTLCDDIFPWQLFLLTPIPVKEWWKLDKNYGYNSYGSSGTMQQALEIVFIIAIVI